MEITGHSRPIEVLTLAVALARTMSTNDLAYSSLKFSKTSGQIDFHSPAATSVLHH